TRFRSPITLGFPHRARAGQEISQRVRLTFDGVPDPDPPIGIELGMRTGGRLPAFGLGTASHGERLTERESALLRTLRLDHLRAELRLGEDGWRAELARAIDDADALGVPLELALFLGDAPGAELRALAAERARVVRFLVLKAGEAAS